MNVSEEQDKDIRAAGEQAQRNAAADPEQLAAEEDSRRHLDADDGSDDQYDDELAQLARERDELKDRLLRTMADYQNFARRAEQNIVQARDQALMDLGRRLLPALDLFDRALAPGQADADEPDAAPEADQAQATPGASDGEAKSAGGDEDAFVTGIRMVHQELIQALESFGIRRIRVKPGDEFDPTRHEAMMKQPAQGIASQHVVHELQAGYTIGDRTLRPAKVAVAP